VSLAFHQIYVVEVIGGVSTNKGLVVISNVAVMLSFIMLSVAFFAFMLSAVMLNVVAPLNVSRSKVMAPKASIHETCRVTDKIKV